MYNDVFDKDAFCEGILLGMSSLGVIIEKWEDPDEMYISVPSETTVVGPDGESLAGEELADRIQTRLRDFGCINLRIKYQIRNEVWTQEKTDRIIGNTLYFK